MIFLAGLVVLMRWRGLGKRSASSSGAAFPCQSAIPGVSRHSVRLHRLNQCRARFYQFSLSESAGQSRVAMEMLLFLLGTAVLVMPLVSFILSIHTRGQVKAIRAELDQLRSLKAPLKPASQPVPPTPEPELKWPPKVTTSIESAKPIPKPPPIPSPKRLPLEKKPQLTPQALPESGLSMEQFMGGRLLAWLGGLSLFLGIVFFVKLSLERGWVSPGVRI